MNSKNQFKYYIHTHPHLGRTGPEFGGIIEKVHKVKDK
jgi:hypothetical protein